MRIYAKRRAQGGGPRRITVAGAVVAAVLAMPAIAQAGTANAGIAGASSTNPIAGLTWGHYTGKLDGVYPAYEQASGADKRLLAEVALRPEAYWFGNWNKDPESSISGFIKNVTGGNSDVLTQITDFGMAPWEHRACHKAPTTAQESAYRSWTDSFAAGIGSSRVALILQPDLPVAECIPSKEPAKLVAWAAQKLSALSHTDVYIDAGAADWLPVSSDVKLLAAAGVRHARGFALDATHYDSTARQILYGQKLVRGLAKRGIHGVHFVIDTAENGAPFTRQSYHGSSFGNAATCRSKKSRRCVTFGIPPTWETGDSAWHLGSKLDAIARKLVDGYLWFGRPWLKGQSGPFDLPRVLQMARTTPFPYSKFPNSGSV